MTMWTAIVIIVALGIISSMYRDYVKKELKQDKQNNGQNDVLVKRLERLEERMANVETILLDEEKRRPFRDLK